MDHDTHTFLCFSAILQSKSESSTDSQPTEEHQGPSGGYSALQGGAEAKRRRCDDKEPLPPHSYDSDGDKSEDNLVVDVSNEVSSSSKIDNLMFTETLLSMISSLSPLALSRLAENFSSLIFFSLVLS
ncbi:hypothetical protein AMECASPLE_017694 [Ameca splendens]|uniref:Uncharacterized protein n=1 Tax=Ameca splendens TaxID=208324 RepID=A0ABV0ZNP5_9TELE